LPDQISGMKPVEASVLAVEPVGKIGGVVPDPARPKAMVAS